MAEQPWMRGLLWRSTPPSGAVRGAESLNGWSHVFVRVESDLADQLESLSEDMETSLPDVLFTMLFWYAWGVHPPLHEQLRRRAAGVPS
ncbi:MAG: hypothetical protein AB7T01_02075 [Acidithiobacillus sp.]